jgi:hypothetical protein
MSNIQGKDRKSIFKLLHPEPDYFNFFIPM